MTARPPETGDAPPLPPRPDRPGVDGELGTAPSLVERPSGPGPRGLPAVAWRVGHAVLLYLVGNVLISQLLIAGTVFAVFGVGDEIVAGDLPSIVAGLFADAAFVVLMLVWLNRPRRRGWVRALGFDWRVGEIARGVGAGLLLYPVIAIGVGFPLLKLFEALFGPGVEAPEQLSTDLGVGARGLAILFAAIAAPVTEELYFRGILFRSIRDRHGLWAGALGSALLFGLVHYVPAPAADALFLMTVMVFTGVGFALLYEWRGNLLTCIAAHVTFNVIGLVAIFGGG